MAQRSFPAEAYDGVTNGVLGILTEDKRIVGDWPGFAIVWTAGKSHFRHLTDPWAMLGLGDA
jgi:hypothetical protein